MEGRGNKRRALLRSRLELAPGDDDIAIDETVEVAADVIALDIHENEGWSDVWCAWREGTSGTSRVDEELAVLLKAVKVVCMTCDQDIAIKLSLEYSECVRIAPWDDLVTVAETDAELLNLNNFGLGPRSRGLRLIEFTADNVDIAGNTAKIIVHLFCAKIARAEHSVNLTRNKKRLELCRDLVCARGHMHITNNKNQNHCL